MIVSLMIILQPFHVIFGQRLLKLQNQAFTTEWTPQIYSFYFDKTKILYNTLLL